MYENSFTPRKMLAAYWKPLRFTGRSTRTELLGYLLIAWFVPAVIGYATAIVGVVSSVQLNLASVDVVNLIFWLPFPALAVRRFHDQNKPGWWALPLIVPTAVYWLGGERILNDPMWVAFAALYLVTAVLLFWKPADGTNHYGPDPRLDSDEADLASE